MSWAFSINNNFLFIIISWQCELDIIWSKNLNKIRRSKVNCLCWELINPTLIESIEVFFSHQTHPGPVKALPTPKIEARISNCNLDDFLSCFYICNFRCVSFDNFRNPDVVRFWSWSFLMFSILLSNQLLLVTYLSRAYWKSVVSEIRWA